MHSIKPESLSLSKEDFYQSLLNALPVPVYYLNRELCYQYANKAYEECLGLPAGTLPGKHLSEVVDIAVFENISLHVAKAQRGKTVRFKQHATCFKKASYNEVTITPDMDARTGEIKGYLVSIEDITQERKTEQLLATLQANEHHYRQLIEGLPAAVYTCDADGYITLFNEAAVKLWGRRPEVGKDLWCGSWKIFYTDGTPMPLDVCPMAIAIKEGRTVRDQEIVVAKPDGAMRHVLPYPSPILDANGKITGAVNMLVDITDRTVAEEVLRENEKALRQLTASLEKKVEERTLELRMKNEELQKSEERYHKMIDEVEDYAIILLSKDGIVQNWNKGAEKIKGYSESEIVGKSFRIFYLPEDQRDGLPERLINEARVNGKAAYEGWRVRKNGTRFWGYVVMTALHDENNEVVGFSKVTRDLTDKKIAEDKLKQYARELEIQNNELEQFVYVASHDMKEPLRKIAFYNQFIQEKITGLLSEKEQLYLNRSVDAAGRMQNLIDDLLTYSRTAIAERIYEATDLNKVLEEVLLLHKETMEEKNASIIMQQLPVINAVPFQMKQLFDNLVGNALKYRHPDRRPHVQVTCETVQEELKMGEITTLKNYYKISVIDNGIGFDASYSEKIFDLFQRLVSKVDYSGTGIGLAICKKIAQNHHGFIRASGKVNEGACFAVYLPVEEARH